MRYRCKVELAADVLSASLKVDKKTHIMNQGNLNFKQLKRYLKIVINAGLLNFDSTEDSYRVTDKGKRFLKIYKGYKKQLLESEELYRSVNEKRNILEEMCFPLNVSKDTSLIDRQKE